MMQSRLELPRVEELDPAQRRIHDDIVATRGNVEGPFLAWLHAPGLAEPAQKLGAFCRYGTSLDLAESELLILAVAAHFDCVGERQIHEPIAIKSGVPEAVVQDIRYRRRPALSERRSQLLFALASELLQTNRLSDDLYEEAQELFGKTAMVETVGLIGYYSLVAMTLNAFDMRKE